MSDNFESIGESLNIKNDFAKNGIVKSTENTEVIKSETFDIQKDYDYTRSNLYSLIEKGQEAINGILELAGEGGSPRAYEVAGQLIKSVGDVTDKLVDLQKKMKDIENSNVKTTTNNVTNNALFVGSTSELSKLLKQGFLNNKEES